MRLIISKLNNGTVVSVQTFERYLHRNKTEEEILEAIKKENDRRGYEYYTIEEVSGIVAEACSFMLGEKQYKLTYDIEDLLDRFEDVHDYAIAIDDDVNDLLNNIEYIKDKINKLNKENEEA